MWTTWGPCAVSCIDREVSLIQGCPLRGVSLWSGVCFQCSVVWPLSAFLARNHVYGHGAIILCVCVEGVIKNACAFCIFDPLPSHM